MDQEKTLILDNTGITQKIKRMAYQIYENNFSWDSIVAVSLADKGVWLADRLVPVLEEISHLRVERIRMEVNKRDPMAIPKTETDLGALDGKSVLLLDDVLNSGRTLIYAACHILKRPVAQLSTAVLIDRKHRKFPIKADFVGLTLSTTLQDHIEVEFSSEGDAAYLVG